MGNLIVGNEPAIAEESELAALARLDHLLESSQATGPRIVGDRDEEIMLPASALRVLHDVVHQLAKGHVVSVASAPRMLTTQQTADILGVSRPYLVQLLEHGDIPYTEVRTHRRVCFEDLMAYKRSFDSVREAALRELTELSEAYGLYDLPAAGPPDEVGMRGTTGRRSVT